MELLGAFESTYLPAHDVARSMDALDPMEVSA